MHWIPWSLRGKGRIWSECIVSGSTAYSRIAAWFIPNFRKEPVITDNCPHDLNNQNLQSTFVWFKSVLSVMKYMLANLIHVYLQSKASMPKQNAHSYFHYILSFDGFQCGYCFNHSDCPTVNTCLVLRIYFLPYYRKLIVLFLNLLKALSSMQLFKHLSDWFRP